MNLPGSFNLSIYRGDLLAFRVILWADPERTDPINLTGVTPKSEIRERSGGLVIAEFAATVTLPNSIDLRMTPAQTSLLLGGGVWDLQLDYGGDKVRTVLAGKVRVVADVTDSDLLVAP